MGLANIQDRVRKLEGMVKVESMRGAGTTLRIVIPLVPAPRIQAGSATHAIDVEAQAAQRVMTEAATALKSGTSAGALAVILIFFGVDVSLVLACIAFAAFQWFRVWEAAWQLADWGGGSPGSPLERELPRSGRSISIGVVAWRSPISALELGYRGYGLLAGVLGLLSLCALYLPLVKSFRSVAELVPAAYAAAGIVGSMALVALILRIRGSSRNLRSLGREARGRQIKTRLAEIPQSLGGWLFLVICGVLWGFGPLALPMHTTGQWANDSTIAILIAWPILDLVEYVHLKHVQTTAGEGAAQA
jgi:hypothetical protein